MSVGAVPTSTTDKGVIAEAVHDTIAQGTLVILSVRGMRSQRWSIALNRPGSLLSFASLLGVACKNRPAPPAEIKLRCACRD